MILHRFKLWLLVAAGWLIGFSGTGSQLLAQEVIPAQITADESSTYFDCVGLDGRLFYPSEDWTWIWLPKGILYQTYWASASEPRLGTQLVSERELGTLLDSTLGGRVGLIRFGAADKKEGWQLDILAGAKLRQAVDDDWDVYSVDFRVDVPLTYRFEEHGLKFAYYHLSSHVGDEYLIKHPNFDRLNFVRDVLALGYSYYPTDELRLYAEVGWGFNTDISEPWEFQFGFDYGPRYATGPQGAPFVAFNVHLRQEVDFGGNVALQAGWAWQGDGLAAGTLRTGLYVLNGKSPQFSFFDQYESQVGIGLWYDF